MMCSLPQPSKTTCHCILFRTSFINVKNNNSHQNICKTIEYPYNKSKFVNSNLQAYTTTQPTVLKTKPSFRGHYLQILGSANTTAPQHLFPSALWASPCLHTISSMCQFSFTSQSVEYVTKQNYLILRDNEKKCSFVCLCVCV